MEIFLGDAILLNLHDMGALIRIKTQYDPIVERGVPRPLALKHQLHIILVLRHPPNAALLDKPLLGRQSEGQQRLVDIQ